MVVVSEGGTSCDLGASLKREIAYFFDAFFFGLIGYVSMKKSPQEHVTEIIGRNRGICLIVAT